MKTKIAFQDVILIFTNRTSVQLIIHTRLFNTKTMFKQYSIKMPICMLLMNTIFLSEHFLTSIKFFWFLHIRLTHRITNLNHFDNEGTDTINVYILISVSILNNLK